MNDKIVIKYNWRKSIARGALVGASVTIILCVIFFLMSEDHVHISEAGYSLLGKLLLIVLLFIIYLIIANGCVKKLVIENGSCVYTNIIGRKKFFLLDEVGTVKYKSDDEVILYKFSGEVLCRLGADMDNLSLLFSLVKQRNYPEECE